MSRVRQLPQIYLRGALANETMRYLNAEQRDEVTQVFTTIAKHPILDGHKNKVIQKLGATIAGDYFDDRQVAMQDYNIAIWRATVYLLHHGDYSYVCESCGKCSYYSKQREKEINFNRRYDICPNCNSICVSDPKDSDLAKGDHIEHDKFLAVISSLQTEDKEPPTSQTCITPIHGKQKIEDPYQIINDPDQVKKYFGQFIWNYFRQIINENEITKHGKVVQTVLGFADCVTADAIIGILCDFSVEYNFDQRNPRNGYYTVDCNAYQSPPEMTLRLCEIISAVKNDGVTVEADHTKIRVSDLGGASPLIDLDVSKNETVLIANKVAASDGKDDHIDVVDQLPERNMYDEGQHGFEQRECLDTVRCALPDGDCKRVFDLTAGVGKIYNDFVSFDPRAVQSNNGISRQNKIAEFLSISTKDVKRHQEVIGIQMMVNGVVQI